MQILKAVLDVVMRKYFLFFRPCSIRGIWSWEKEAWPLSSHNREQKGEKSRGGGAGVEVSITLPSFAHQVQ